jgi:uncharacterized membrane protein
MAAPAKNRIESIDLLKGLVMVIMALDHTRDYLHISARMYNPTDPMHTTWAIYLTRFITHFCAPAFSFLAGTSAFMVGKRKPVRELSAFLFKRGLWLIFIELTIINFAWFFDPGFHNPSLVTIWSLGISMIVLAGLVYTPRPFILAFSLLLIFGHNLLDGVRFDNPTLTVIWAILHHVQFFPLSDTYSFNVDYPAIPWIAVMSLGYWFGSFYDSSFEPRIRKGLFNIIGFAAIALFMALRFANVYGDPRPWKEYHAIAQSAMSFFDPSKYPPSLLFLLMTLGPVLVFLANSERLKGTLVNFFTTFGRVPFFYYILHIYLIHFIAMVLAQITGFGWQKMILTQWVTAVPGLNGFGFDLGTVYIIWISVIITLYPICKSFDQFKQSHKEIWWLSYL